MDKHEHLHSVDSSFRHKIVPIQAHFFCKKSILLEYMNYKKLIYFRYTSIKTNSSDLEICNIHIMNIDT